MGAAHSETKNAPELISNTLNEIVTSSIVKNSVEDTNVNSIKASCDPKVIENINALCAESQKLQIESADNLYKFTLDNKNAKDGDALKVRKDAMAVPNIACSSTLCTVKDITQKISRSIKTDDTTVATITADMKSAVNLKVDQVVKPDMDIGLGSAYTSTDLGTKIKNTINNHISSTSLVETLRKFSNTNSLDLTNVGAMNINQEVAGTAYAASVINSINKTDSSVIAEMQAALDYSPKIKTMSLNIGMIVAILGVVGVLVIIIAVAFALKSQKNGMQFAKENPELIKMMMAAPAGPAGMAAMAAMPPPR
jgi:hypothetical protein